MLIWVNGPFGGGKTQTAYELHRRLPGSVVCDPELVGFGLQRMTPPPLRADFQDYPAWRQGVVEVLDRTLTRLDGVVIAPMTLVDPVYFDETVGRLRSVGHVVHHVTLLAERDVVVARLRQRAAGRLLPRALLRQWTPARESFALDHLDHCLEQLRSPLFAEHVRTDALTVPEVAERVAAAAGLELRPRSGGRGRQRLRELWTSVRHIRFD